MGKNLILLAILFTVINNVEGKIHKLTTSYSSILELRNSFLCNYDDIRKSVTCYKTSLSNPDLFEKRVIASEGKAYEICGLKLGEGFIGSFYRSSRHNVSSAQGRCSVWLAPEINPHNSSSLPQASN